MFDQGTMRCSAARATGVVLLVWLLCAGALATSLDTARARGGSTGTERSIADSTPKEKGDVVPAEKDGDEAGSGGVVNEPKHEVLEPIAAEKDGDKAESGGVGVEPKHEALKPVDAEKDGAEATAPASEELGETADLGQLEEKINELSRDLSSSVDLNRDKLREQIEWIEEKMKLPLTATKSTPKFYLKKSGGGETTQCQGKEETVPALLLSEIEDMVRSSCPDVSMGSIEPVNNKNRVRGGVLVGLGENEYYLQYSPAAQHVSHGESDGGLVHESGNHEDLEPATSAAAAPAVDESAGDVSVDVFTEDGDKICTVKVTMDGKTGCAAAKDLVLQKVKKLPVACPCDTIGGTERREGIAMKNAGECVAEKVVFTKVDGANTLAMQLIGVQSSREVAHEEASGESTAKKRENVRVLVKKLHDLRLVTQCSLTVVEEGGMSLVSSIRNALAKSTCAIDGPYKLQLGSRSKKVMTTVKDDEPQGWVNDLGDDLEAVIWEDEKAEEHVREAARAIEESCSHFREGNACVLSGKCCWCMEDYSDDGDDDDPFAEMTEVAEDYFECKSAAEHDRRLCSCDGDIKGKRPFVITEGQTTQCVLWEKVSDGTRVSDIQSSLRSQIDSSHCGDMTLTNDEKLNVMEGDLKEVAGPSENFNEVFGNVHMVHVRKSSD